jgi:hypothetical protein
MGTSMFWPGILQGERLISNKCSCKCQTLVRYMLWPRGAICTDLLLARK